jgi:hypothetical protein
MLIHACHRVPPDRLRGAARLGYPADTIPEARLSHSGSVAEASSDPVAGHRFSGRNGCAYDPMPAPPIQLLKIGSVESFALGDPITHPGRYCTALLNPHYVGRVATVPLSILRLVPPFSLAP